MKKPFDIKAPYQPDSFAFSKGNEKKIAELIARYPKGRQKSAVMPLLDLAQRQMAEEGAELSPPVGGWIPRAAMDEIARILDMPPIKVYEVATFYSMYNLAPVGKYLVQICTTTPCWLCSSDSIVKACKEHLGIGMGEMTADGYFSLMEVECLGACVNAPMVQINDDFYEDLNYERMVDILKSLRKDEKPSIGSQTGRKGSMAQGGSTTLKNKANKKGTI